MNLNESTNPKHGREVCRQWLNGGCQKGPHCEFLHRIDETRMPTCPQGSLCESHPNKVRPGNPVCPQKHPVKVNRCANYDAGFCSFGLRCAHEHVFVAEVPETNPYFLEQPVRVTHANQKKGPCSQFQMHGWCPQFEMCNFKHEK